MENSQNSKNSQIPFIDYVPAEVQATNSEEWRIVFYVRKPGTDQLKRFRRRVRKVTGASNRMRYAKRICTEINIKLSEGWSPFLHGYAKKEYRPLIEVMDLYLEQERRKCKDGLIRPDSLRAYTSYCKNLEDYLKLYKKTALLSVEFDKKFVLDFLDYIYFYKKRAARTSNNYLAFCNLLATFMKDREYIAVNPANGIDRRRVGKKKREVIPAKVRNEVFKYQAEHNPSYLALCLTVYFCFIRRTEISKLLVKYVDLENNTIFVPGQIAKNGKDGIVTIPGKLKNLMTTHLDGSVQEDFLFSQDNFKAGKKQLKPKKISDEWSNMKKALDFKTEYQFYSLKDTGITELFLLNVPVIKIRDQARHHDIKITETYTPRNYICDDTIKEINFNF